MGPMQFLPGTWSRYASDGNGDGKADVQNVFDATLAAARYLCSGGLNLRDQSQVMTAILRYNNSAGLRPERAGLGGRLRDRRRAGGPAADRRAGSADRGHPPGQLTQGLGPGLPMNVLGLPANDRSHWFRWSTWTAPTWPGRCSARCPDRHRRRVCRDRLSPG